MGRIICTRPVRLAFRLSPYRRTALTRCIPFAVLLFVIAGRPAAAQPTITPGPSSTTSSAPNAQPGPPKITPGASQPGLPREGVDFFEKKIRPVLVRSCYKCHSGDPAKAKSHFVLDTHDGLRKGGDSGAVVAPKHREKSLLVEAVKYEGLQMPPDGQLPDGVIADFEKWVEMGAPDPRIGKAANPRNKIDMAAAQRYWAFQRPQASPPPDVHDTKWPASDIDRFVLARLEKDLLKPVHDADRVTLIRRLTFDLTGLPPTPEEIDAFVNDRSASAYASVVDRLLDSPRFGERWGRHWLDVVRFAESTGKEQNVPYRYAWRYRDYVIDSFNADKPYDKFIVEQLAGDLIRAGSTAERNTLLIATGFLAIGPKSAATNNPEQFKVDVIDDQIDVTGRAFLGLTIACARCHDHKFDPIPQTDYYAMAGIFHSTETFDAVKPGEKTSAAERLLKLPGQEKPPPSGPSKQAGQSKEEQARLQEPYPKPQISPAAPAELAMGVRDADIPNDFHVLVGGELKDRGPNVPRGALTVLQTPESAHINSGHSGRMELAHWIADRKNPLTARVMVNRVWEHLFGQGLVDTVDNFGALGNVPSHPELLDTLAVQFMEQKWSVKRLIRTLVLSRVYQLSSDHHDGNYGIDPGDKFLWRMPRRRLDAEEIRDAMLMASGQLDLERPYGSPVMELSNQGVDDGKGMQEVRKPSNVRSVYLPILRGLVPDILAAFDVADPNLIVGKRDVTTVPTQALFLMNNPFVLKQSEEMAKRVLKPDGLDQQGRINLAYRLALGRLPTESERTAVTKFIVDYRQSFEGAKQKGNPQVAAWTSFCQTLFQSGQFRYLY
jgi:hypothetical protein